MDEDMREYSSGAFTFSVTAGETTTLSFLCDGEVITAIQLTKAGAEALGMELLRAWRTI